MTQVKIFNAKITDEYGGEYPNAVVAIRAFSETSQSTGKSENCEGDYIVENEIDAITYKANYWYSAKTKGEGFRTRPLVTNGEDGFTDVFEVDLTKVDVQTILGGTLPLTDKVLQVIELDLRRKFS